MDQEKIDIANGILYYLYDAQGWRGQPEVYKNLQRLGVTNRLIHTVAKILNKECLLELKESLTSNPGYELTADGILLISEGKNFSDYWREKIERQERESLKEQDDFKLKNLQIKYLISKISPMKHVEKLDLVLRELYKHRFDGILYSITDILAEIGGNPNLQEAKMIGKRLEEDGYIVYVGSFDSADAYINSRGIQYCESSSYIDHSIPISGINYDYLFAKPGSQITKDHVRGLVAQSKMDEAIKALSNFPKPQTIQDVLDTQLGRLTRINTDFYYGFITHEEKETQMVRISAALIEIINSL